MPNTGKEPRFRELIEEITSIAERINSAVHILDAELFGPEPTTDKTSEDAPDCCKDRLFRICRILKSADDKLQQIFEANL